MSRAFDWFDSANLTWLIIAMLIIVAASLAWMLREAQREAARQQRRAEEAECWLQLSDEEIAAVRRRLADVERRHANLQAMYAQLTRRLLARNFFEIEQHVRRKRV